MINKKKKELATPADHKVKIKYKKRKEGQVLGLDLRTKKIVEDEGNGGSNYNWHVWNGLQRLENHPDNSIVEINQNTEKSPGNLKRFAVTGSERPSANAGVKDAQ